MAINTDFIDNAVIDFTQISNLLQTLKSHDELFMKFANGAMGSVKVDAATAKDVPAQSFQLASVSYTDKMSQGTLKPAGAISFGKTFNGTPIVTATVTSSNTGISPVVYLTDVSSTGCTIIARDLSTAKYSGSVTINILAFGYSG